jgi:3'-5' exoribonuclease
MKDFYIQDAVRFENKVITSFFAVSARQVRPKKTGEPYLQLTLADRTGQIEAKMWDNVPATMNTFEAGDCVKVEGEINRYNGRFQLVVRKLRKTAEGEHDPADFLPATTRNVEEMWAELRGVVASFADANLRALVDSFLDDPVIARELRVAPAAKALHHAWIGGLLEHIVSLLALADSVVPHYPRVNRDLLLTGVVLHDIGKLTELTYGNCFAYSLEGQMLGHITIGLRMVQQRIVALPDFPAKLQLLVEHILLSHHGKYEFGSPKLPMIPEAVMLNMLDDLDAKMQMMQEEFKRHQNAGNDGGKMTEWVRAMERPLLDTSKFLAEAGPAMGGEECPPEEAVAVSAQD